MRVHMRVRLAQRIDRPVNMLVVLVVDVCMGMRERFVLVPVLVPFGQMQPHAEAHEHGGCQKRERQRLSQQRNC